MKGVILAGGTGSRLFPLTKAINKHLLPVGYEPMLYHPIKKLTSLEVENIMVVVGIEHAGSVINCLGSGKDLNCNLTYAIQEEAGGIAQALGLTEDFCRHEDQFCVLLGDNIFEDELNFYKQAHIENQTKAHVLLKKVSNPSRFGIATFESGRITEIVEKPERPKSNYAVTGVYFYTPHIFEVIKTLVPSERGELEISEVHDIYVKENNLSYSVLEGWWTDAGSLESLTYANALIKMDL